MKMVVIVAQTFIGEAKLPAIVHRFIGPSYKEARNLFRLHRKNDAMLRETTGQKKAGDARATVFEGLPLKTTFRVKTLDIADEANE